MPRPGTPGRGIILSLALWGRHGRILLSRRIKIDPFLLHHERTPRRFLIDRQDILPQHPDEKKLYAAQEEHADRHGVHILSTILDVEVIPSIAKSYILKKFVVPLPAVRFACS